MSLLVLGAALCVGAVACGGSGKGSTTPVAATGPEISVVIPCLNEESAISEVVGWAWEGIEHSGRSGEVIVVDNGSTDRSVELATEAGARVVHEKRRGYGSAYLRGLGRNWRCESIDERPVHRRPAGGRSQLVQGGP